MDIVPRPQEDLILSRPTSLDQNPAAVYLSDKAETSRRVLLSDLRAISALIGADTPFSVNWGAFRYQHTTMVRAALVTTRSDTTVNRMLSALKGVLKAAWLLDQMSAEDYHKSAAVKGVKATILPAGREILPDELARLFEACRDGTASGMRDEAVFAAMYAGGLRRAEVVGLTIRGYTRGENAHLQVLGKGNKQRLAFLSESADAIIDKWVTERGTELQCGALFVPVNKYGTLVDRAMTTQAVYGILTKRAFLAEIDSISPHDMRRTFVTNLLSAGVDIAIVAGMAGHASVDTTRRYDKRADLVKSEASQYLQIPE